MSTRSDPPPEHGTWYPAGSTRFEEATSELPIVFPEPGGRVVINYGILTGREATQAEIDRLAQSLYSEAGAGPDLTITAVRRQDYGRDIETVSHQVIVEVTGGLAADVQAMCRAWAIGCADDRRIAPLER